MPAAIIGGTGIYEFPAEGLASETVVTPYGDVTLSRSDSLIFLNRHAPGHSVPPHKVNYRANISALKAAGVRRMICLYATGLLDDHLALATPVILDDVLDFTKGRANTFFDSLENAKGHVDMSQPFCPVLSAALKSSAAALHAPVQTGGILACMNGPRFETPAEIRMLQKLGANLVGMTVMPELPLAREAGISIAAMGFAINLGAGMRADIEFIENCDAQRLQMLKIARGALSATHDKDCKPSKIF